MLNWEKDYDVEKNPEWVGLRHKMSVMIEETQSYWWGQCFI